MEAKLIKKSENYYELYEVRTNLTLLIGSTDSEKKIDVYGKDAHKLLSLKNCQEIENGYDLDGLVDEVYPVPENSILPIKSMNMANRRAFKGGFQKALSILGDKKFSEEDMINFAEYCKGDLMKTKDLFNEYQSLQQTEWEVEILEVENDEVYSVSENMKVAHNKAFDGVLFKYDADNCLILKRK